MIFVDTSAVVAILNNEAEADGLTATLAASSRRLISPAVRLETCMVLSRSSDISVSDAAQLFDAFVRTAEIEEIPIDEAIGRLAVACFETYGKGRHPARLNYADCLAYAAAKAHRARLLYKGGDFRLTDVDDFS